MDKQKVQVQLRAMTDPPRILHNVIVWEWCTIYSEWVPYMAFHDGDRWQHTDESLIEELDGMAGWHYLISPDYPEDDQ